MKERQTGNYNSAFCYTLCLDGSNANFCVNLTCKCQTVLTFKKHLKTRYFNG